MFAIELETSKKGGISPYQLVWVVPHDLPILARAGFALVGVDHEVLGPPIVRLVHEAPLEPRRKPGAASAPQTALFDLVHDPLVSLLYDLLQTNDEVTVSSHFS